MGNRALTTPCTKKDGQNVYIRDVKGKIEKSPKHVQNVSVMQTQWEITLSPPHAHQHSHKQSSRPRRVGPRLRKSETTCSAHVEWANRPLTAWLAQRALRIQGKLTVAAAAYCCTSPARHSLAQPPTTTTHTHARKCSHLQPCKGTLPLQKEMREQQPEHPTSTRRHSQGTPTTALAVVAW
jgi:hypothetical protein